MQDEETADDTESNLENSSVRDESEGAFFDLK